MNLLMFEKFFVTFFFCSSVQGNIPLDPGNQQTSRPQIPDGISKLAGCNCLTVADCPEGYGQLEIACVPETEEPGICCVPQQGVVFNEVSFSKEGFTPKNFSKEIILNAFEKGKAILKTEKDNEKERLRLGEICENSKLGEPNMKTCGDYLKCSDKGICECEEGDFVCGSDGVTYSSVCQLIEATAENRDLTLVERTPCRTGPVIKTPPKDAVRPLGSILVLDCEATGYPVATITWELYKADGSTTQLPSDDSLVAVQMRGGPEKNMVTGWVQIMKILPENIGIYTCIATNEKGQVKASAQVSFKKDNLAENEL